MYVIDMSILLVICYKVFILEPYFDLDIVISYFSVIDL